MSRAIQKTGQALASLAILTALSGTASAERLDFQRLNLINGWERFTVNDARRPGIAIDSNGVVYLRGVIAQDNGTSAVAFVLPKKYRPNGLVYVTACLSGGAAGRLKIQPDGNVIVQAAVEYSSAQSVTSLEGIKYSKH